MQSFDPVWDEIYGSGQQLNRYPFSSVVTFLFRNRPRDKDRAATRILEVGCGAGNNLWFAAREGFDVSGIDASEPVIDHARKWFDAEGLNADLRVADFTALPFEDASFDLVIERAGFSQAPKPVVKRAVQEVARVLVPGGALHSEIYSDRATAHGQKMDGGMILSEDGPYAGVGQIAFYSKNEIEDLFQGCLDLEKLHHVESVDMSTKPYEVYANWEILARKPKGA